MQALPESFIYSTCIRPHFSPGERGQDKNPCPRGLLLWRWEAEWREWPVPRLCRLCRAVHTHKMVYVRSLWGNPSGRGCPSCWGRRTGRALRGAASPRGESVQANPVPPRNQSKLGSARPLKEHVANDKLTASSPSAGLEARLPVERD